MVTSTVKIANIHRILEEKSPNLVQCKNKRPRKLKGGPGIMGAKHPTRPKIRKKNPRITRK
jgi:hypothetical protein